MDLFVYFPGRRAMWNLPCSRHRHVSESRFASYCCLILLLLVLDTQLKKTMTLRRRPTSEGQAKALTSRWHP
jgi:hypothetical protein